MSKIDLLEQVWALIASHRTQMSEEEYFDLLEDIRIEAGIRAEDIIPKEDPPEPG